MPWCTNCDQVIKFMAPGASWYLPSVHSVIPLIHSLLLCPEIRAVEAVISVVTLEVSVLVKWFFFLPVQGPSWMRTESMAPKPLKEFLSDQFKRGCSSQMNTCGRGVEYVQWAEESGELTPKLQSMKVVTSAPSFHPSVTSLVDHANEAVTW